LAVYNRVSEQRLGENTINRLLVKFGTVDRRPGSGKRRAHTDKNVDTVESLLLGQEPQSHWTEKFHVRRGIRRSSVSQIIHKDLRLKCFKNRRAQQLTEAHSMHALFSACSLRDNNVITSNKQIYMKTETCKLYSRACQISSKSIHILSSYAVSNLGRFWDTM